LRLGRHIPARGHLICLSPFRARAGVVRAGEETRGGGASPSSWEIKSEDSFGEILKLRGLYSHSKTCFILECIGKAPRTSTNRAYTHKCYRQFHNQWMLMWEWITLNTLTLKTEQKYQFYVNRLRNNPIVCYTDKQFSEKKKYVLLDTEKRKHVGPILIIQVIWNNNDYAK
jgi:hypothetical protein